jgi:hypothetical protein
MPDFFGLQNFDSLQRIAARNTLTTKLSDLLNVESQKVASEDSNLLAYRDFNFFYRLAKKLL